jgi:hypothetical protein
MELATAGTRAEKPGKISPKERHEMKMPGPETPRHMNATNHTQL